MDLQQLLSFSCQTCGSRLPDTRHDPPKWASFVASSSLSWSAETIPAVSNVFERLDETPQYPQVHLVRVDGHFLLPRRVVPTWVLYQPALSANNGWLEYPQEICDSALVKIQVLEILTVSSDHAWLRIQVLETLPLARIDEIVPVRSPDAPPGADLLMSSTNGSDISRVDVGDLCYLDFNAQGDLGEWVLCGRRDGRWNLLLYGEWGSHYDLIYVGHRPLSAEEWCALSAEKPKA